MLRAFPRSYPLSRPHLGTLESLTVLSKMGPAMPMVATAG